MKMKLETHQEMQKNSTEYAVRERARIDREIKQLEELECANNFRQIQIDTAIKKEIFEYDADRFCVPKVIKEVAEVNS